MNVPSEKGGDMENARCELVGPEISLCRTCERRKREAGGEHFFHSPNRELGICEWYVPIDLTEEIERRR